MKSEKYGERRGAAFGLAGVAKGFKVSSLKKYGIVATLHEGLQDRFVCLPVWFVVWACLKFHCNYITIVAWTLMLILCHYCLNLPEIPGS